MTRTIRLTTLYPGQPTGEPVPEKHSVTQPLSLCVLYVYLLLSFSISGGSYHLLCVVVGSEYRLAHDFATLPENSALRYLEATPIPRPFSGIQRRLPAGGSLAASTARRQMAVSGGVFELLAVHVLWLCRVFRSSV